MIYYYRISVPYLVVTMTRSMSAVSGTPRVSHQAIKAAAARKRTGTHTAIAVKVTYILALASTCSAVPALLVAAARPFFFAVT